MNITINLREYYPWYETDEYTEVSEEVAAELAADKRTQGAHELRMRRNKVFALTERVMPNAEHLGIITEEKPDDLLMRKERYTRLCAALNSLSETQGRRVEAKLIFGMTYAEIARAEGVYENAVRKSVAKALARMRKYLKKYI